MEASMPLPAISIINFSSKLKDFDVQEAIRAVNRQIAEDFMPVWGNGRTLILHAAAFDPSDLSTLTEEPVRGAGVIYLVDEATLPGALGYHDLNAQDLPVGFVFVLYPDDWTVTLSHEVLELIIDPTVNLFAPGPDPRDPQKIVLHSYEVCDAVERTGYQIDEIDVSNFLTPSYFTIGEAPGTRNDFLGVGVESFSVTKGSHIAFIDLETGTYETVFGQLVSSARVSAARAKMYDHAKPGRPADDVLGKILDDCRKDLPKSVKLLEGPVLPGLRGITRTARYREAARRITSQIAAASAKTRGIPTKPTISREPEKRPRP